MKPAPKKTAPPVKRRRPTCRPCRDALASGKHAGHDKCKGESTGACACANADHWWGLR